MSKQAFAGDSKNGQKESTRVIILKVSANNGEELAGTRIFVAETGKEYYCDFNGNVQLELKKNETLTLKLTSLGFEEKQLKSSELGTFNEVFLSSLP